MFQSQRDRQEAFIYLDFLVKNLSPKLNYTILLLGLRIKLYIIFMILTLENLSHCEKSDEYLDTRHPTKWLDDTWLSHVTGACVSPGCQQSESRVDDSG